MVDYIYNLTICGMDEHVNPLIEKVISQWSIYSLERDFEKVISQWSIYSLERDFEEDYIIGKNEAMKSLLDNVLLADM